MMQENFQENPSEKKPLVEKKKWYKKWWGIFTIILIFIIVALLINFLAHFLYYYSQIKNGQIPFSPSGNIDENFSVTKIDSSRLFRPEDPGVNQEIPVNVVGFFDFRCPYSAQVRPALRELQAAYIGKVNFIFRNFPLTKLYPDAMLAAQAGECAHLQDKFWAMSDKIFSDKSKEEIAEDDLKIYAQQVGIDVSEFSSCLNSEQSKSLVLHDVEDGEALGIKGTPTWFVGNQKIEGTISREKLQKIIDDLLKNNGEIE